MLNKFIAVLSLMVASLAFMPAAFAGHHNEGDHGMKKDIVDVAAENGSFNTLVAAIKAAGLVDTLKSEGPFTVFAPTDEAFAKLPEGTVEMLLEPENKDKLASILTYHVVSGKVMSTDVVKIDSATSVQGEMLMVEVVDGNVMINNAKIIMADVKASNGVIHVIDTVLMPK
ncbi:fasciclin domain-containing protein [Colwellia sp. MB3u-4]|uniref:fasciclin domain-containing protein n=1 Tax=Colwellia sp. MB3u-4 TaxID=2759822 RepID=UPI0015F6CB50|nr:fasciclin domain-containing protein [Colwellia sp. MB3u-4]MBA6289157.1 fasciclin domain-containing protein [Colwellia sp. MB3u-4]